MKINDKILSIPPYLSTSWKNVVSLHAEQSEIGLVLIVTLTANTRIEIPNLEESILEAVFAAHTHYLDQEYQVAAPRAPIKMFSQGDQSLFGFPIRIASGNVSDGLSPLIGHNPEQSDAPQLPEEILNKISSIAKIVAIDNPDSLPKPEPHCSCPYCQIARAIQKTVHPASLEESEKTETVTIEEENIAEEDLRFSDWFIQKTADNVYSVTNPLDQKEHYSVHLGEPIGCTCGNHNCEHIQAVLRT